LSPAALATLPQGPQCLAVCDSKLLPVLSVLEGGTASTLMSTEAARSGPDFSWGQGAKFPRCGCSHSSPLSVQQQPGKHNTVTHPKESKLTLSMPFLRGTPSRNINNTLLHYHKGEWKEGIQNKYKCRSA
jgi:hypothetical protein